tara:strand:- start:7968 stop:8171 length:204 start_codon:yes stop_codon:yes gene_type:complete
MINDFVNDEDFKDKIREGIIFVNMYGTVMEVVDKDKDNYIHSIDRFRDRYYRMKREIEIDKILLNTV